MSLFNRQASPGQSPGLPWLPILAVAVVAVCGSAGFLLQNAHHPAIATDAAPLSASGFDINYVPAPRQAAAPAAPLAAAAPVQASPAPLPPTRAPVAAAQAPAAPTGALQRVTSILTSPAQYLIAQTYFGSSAKLLGFLKDQKRMGYYMANPITREALSSPMMIKLLARPAVVHAFIASPAMSDDRAVAALAQSPLLTQILRSPGVQENLADGQLVAGLMQDTQVAQWLGQHPSATLALNQAQPR